MQAGIAKSMRSGIGSSALHVRGVVTATYVADDPGHPYVGQGPIGIYCDVLVYTSLNGGRIYPLFAVLVKQETSSIQEGRIWRPRATTQDLSGKALDPASEMDFMSWDGDHVLVTFIDDDRTLPVIIGCLPHPRADIGISGGQAPGQRMRLTLADGRPHLTKHAGAVWGADASGNLVLDASRGTAGDVLPGGAQAPPSGQGSVLSTAHATGSHTRTLALPAGPISTPVATETFTAAGMALNFLTGPGGFSVAGAAGPVFAFAAPGVGAPTPSLKLGNGGTQAADAGKVAAAINALVATFNAHTHLCASPGSPSAVPVPQASPAPPMSISSLSLPP